MTTAADRRARTAAAALQACLHQTAVLSAGERQLLGELLERIANGDEVRDKPC